MKDMQIVLETEPTVAILTNAEEVYITVIPLPAVIMSLGLFHVNVEAATVAMALC